MKKRKWSDKNEYGIACKLQRESQKCPIEDIYEQYLQAGVMPSNLEKLIDSEVKK